MIEVALAHNFIHRRCAEVAGNVAPWQVNAYWIFNGLILLKICAEKQKYYKSMT